MLRIGSLCASLVIVVAFCQESSAQRVSSVGASEFDVTSAQRSYTGEYEELANLLLSSGFRPQDMVLPRNANEAFGGDPCVPSANGCGPGAFFGVLLNCPLGLVCLKPACDIHDYCYSTCGVPKSTCDILFWSQMFDICNDSFADGSFPWFQCQFMAFVYYQVVDIWGDTFYTGAQTDICACAADGAVSVVIAPPATRIVRSPFVDNDRDLMSDKWELAMGLDLTCIDTLDDYDGDGLINLAEFINNLDPLNPDTDGDGITDDIEVLQAQAGCCP
jgi:group XII secretory phospholipase A2 precursor (PLA2G12)